MSSSSSTRDSIGLDHCNGVMSSCSILALIVLFGHRSLLTRGVRSVSGFWTQIRSIFHTRGQSVNSLRRPVSRAYAVHWLRIKIIVVFQKRRNRQVPPLIHYLSFAGFGGSRESLLMWRSYFNYNNMKHISMLKIAKYKTHTLLYCTSSIWLLLPGSVL